LLSRDPVAWDWPNEVAVITGGSNGLGAKLVHKLVAHGLKVAVLDVQPLSTEINSDGTLSFYKCDITSPASIHEAAQAIRAELGSPSILINNAGIGNAHSIMDASPQSLRTIFDVNLISHWYTVQEFLPDMIARKKGHIMATASMAAFLGLAGMVDYSCTKVGLQAFYEGLAQELKHRYNSPYIKTTVVYPGWFRTRLIAALEKSLEKARAPVGDAEDVAAAMIRQILAGRSGQLILGPSAASVIRASPIWLQEVVRDWMAHVVEVRATTAVA
jgi:NAD(P)-dependent dehydrogenase (short-subunit alcohol dehydrogenase family)